MTYLKVAALSGCAVASPVVFYQFWLFVAPGLYPKEKKQVLPLVVCSTVLFLAGVAFAYFVIFDFAFQFFMEFTSDEVVPVLSINAYLSVVTRLLLAFGISFQLPILVYFLARSRARRPPGYAAFLQVRRPWNLCGRLITDPPRRHLSDIDGHSTPVSIRNWHHRGTGVQHQRA